MITGWDVDGVGHTFSAGVHDHMRCEGVEHLWKSVPGDPYWNWYAAWGWTDKEFVDFCNRAADHGCLFTGHVRDGYKESIQRVHDAGHDIIIVTDRSFGSSPSVSEQLTLDWFDKEGIYYDDIVFSRDKTVVWTDTFIDDKIDNYEALRRAGTNAFLLTRPWNIVTDGPDYRMRVDTIEEYANAIVRHGDRMKPKKVYVN